MYLYTDVLMIPQEVQNAGHDIHEKILGGTTEIAA